MRTKKILLTILGLLIVLVGVLHLNSSPRISFIDELERRAYDARLRMTMPGGLDPRVVIVDLDEKSIREFGWPWDRDRMALLIHTLFDSYFVETVGLDIVFAEPDDDRTLTELKDYYSENEVIDPAVAEILSRPERDDVLAEVMQFYNVVLGYAFDAELDAHSSGQLPEPVFNRRDDMSKFTLAPKATRYTGNLGKLQKDSPGGFFSLLNNDDADGIIRRVSLLNQYGKHMYESFALSVARNYLGTEPEPVIVPGFEISPGDTNAYAPLEAIDIGFSRVGVDAQAAVYVPYRGYPEESFRYISAVDILNGQFENQDDLAGTIALLGTSAKGLVDLRATPVAGVYPGVEVHANLIAGLLDGHFKSQPQTSVAIEFLSLIFIGGILALLLPHLSAAWMSLAAIVALSILLFGNFYAWSRLDYVMPVATTLVCVISLYLFNMIYGFFHETRSRLALKQSFGLYVPPEIVDEMNESDEQVSLTSEKRNMTVLFTDVRGFTTISESLEPEALSELMNAFLTPMTRVVHENRGAIDKYMGDAMMAFWGAPLKDESHAQHCVDAAFEMCRQVELLNQDFKARDWPELKIGIGICTGNMSVGNMGSEFRMAYTVLGDSVNLGSRLEGLTKQYGVQVLVSESTTAEAAGTVFREVDSVRVKGKLEPVKIYEPVGSKGQVSSDELAELDAYQEGLAAYQRQKWDLARTRFTNLQNQQNRTLYQVYLDRIEHFESSPPGPEWDGVYTFTTK
ncbi:MAG: adenylate/guanylate cyclase domain-containing protein [Pseudomonadota bacterium]